MSKTRVTLDRPKAESPWARSRTMISAVVPSRVEMSISDSFDGIYIIIVFSFELRLALANKSSHLTVIESSFYFIQASYPTSL